MNCAWCGRPLYEGHGYSEDGMPICASYSPTPSKVYCACKARAHRLREKQAKAIKASSSQEKTTGDASSVLVERLTEALQVIISQNDELIALQRQNQGTVKVVEKTTITEKTFEAPSFDDLDLDLLEVKKDTSTNSVQNFIDSMNNIQNVVSPPKSGKRMQ